MNDEAKRQLSRDWAQLGHGLTEFSNEQTRYANALQATSTEDLGRGDRESDLRALKKHSLRSPALLT